ncbi:hypothetical protein Tco_0770621 [Tanacetum coccineum]|uniref:Homologous recombination OB-fold protein OB-fold domain-containing protein n=1 Tax=Tanacetum coccineum TaxID=301880 RepID=A0ABQ4ZG38_9ASTR
MNSPPNHEWELSLDIDDFDLRLSPFIRSCNSHHNVKTTTTIDTIVSLHTPNVDNCDENPVRIISGPASIVQAAKLRKIADIREGVEEFVMSTQEYIRKVVEDVARALVTLKDLSGTLSGTIHYKVLAEGGYGKDITLEAALILHNILVFTPKPSVHYINIIRRNLVKVFHKDTIIGNGSGVGGIIGMKYLRRLLIILRKNYFVLKIKWSANTRELAKVWRINWKVDTGELKGCLDDGSREKKAVLDGSYRLFFGLTFMRHVLTAARPKTQFLIGGGLLFGTIRVLDPALAPTSAFLDPALASLSSMFQCLDEYHQSLSKRGECLDEFQCLDEYHQSLSEMGECLDEFQCLCLSQLL